MKPNIIILLLSGLFLLPHSVFCQSENWDARLKECNDPFSDRVNALATTDDYIYVGNEQFYPYIRRWSIQDGTWDEDIGGGLNGGRVNVIVADGNEIIVGGNFTSAGGDPTIRKLARWDGNIWHPINIPIPEGVNYEIAEILKSGSRYYILARSLGGLVNTSLLRKIWDWDGADTFIPISETGLQANCTNSNLGCGPYSKALINTIAVLDGELYIGGNHSIVIDDGQSPEKRYFAKNSDPLNGIWAAVPAFDYINCRGVNKIIEHEDGLTLGGTFRNMTFDPLQYDLVLRYDDTNGFQFIGSHTDDGDYHARTLHYVNGKLFIGGIFNGIGENPNAEHMAWWDGSNWHDFDYDNWQATYAITSDDSGIYLGGTSGLAHFYDSSCPKYRDVSHDTIVEGSYSAAEELSASGTVIGNVTFSAGSSIVLKPNEDCAKDFTATVSAGDSFTASIENCVPPPSALSASDPTNFTQNNNIATEEAAPFPSALSLNCYPNPLQAGNTTLLSFHLPNEESIYLGIYDLNGREVVNLFNGSVFENGNHTLELATSRLQSGMYLVLMRTPSQKAVQRLIVLD